MRTIAQIFVAFSEKLNFTIDVTGILSYESTVVQKVKVLSFRLSAAAVDNL